MTYAMALSWELSLTRLPSVRPNVLMTIDSPKLLYMQTQPKS